MSDEAGAEGPVPCRGCGQTVPADRADYHGLCPHCRARVVKRATWLAVPGAVLVAVVYVWVLAQYGMFESRFVVVWIALGAGLAYITFKVARRVLFDVVRSRGPWTA